MKNSLTLFTLLLFFTITSFANDGAYYISGNHLIPMIETDISVKKEILTIKRRNEKQVDVTVYYEFYNPKDAKSLTVGFEAFSPSGDVDPTPKNGRHPYMNNFTVEMNDVIFPYNVSIVSDSLYNKNGTIKELTKSEIEEHCYEGYSDFYYVYHFTANFKPGLNSVKHTYTCDLSGGVDYKYSFDYILSAAMRWGNHQIDDFTLIIDMGEFQDFYINNAPFGKSSKWTLAGTGNMQKDVPNPFGYEESEGISLLYTRFFVSKGQAIYQKMNYKTKDELTIFSRRVNGLLVFDYREAQLPFYIDDNESMEYIEPADEISKKILRNLPFARRGYIFTTPQIQAYYLTQAWYTPDPNYKSTFDSLTNEEQKWVNYWSK
ncbi:YARHG domain-containing protein [Dysgonomonas sp. ZJ709]|uniref:YARHG domain-containing protein n=1 Tax=Dysgonomonas sp. ZJ709 TaxID=2709797 RepID=UPI0013ED57A6|nr:YARHG domain-containing protein [Dysgonomonas sp. ZJ709]